MGLIFRRAVLDHDVLALDKACLLQALTEGDHEVHSVSERGVPQEPNHRHPRLLRARRERPRDRYAAEQRDERAALRGAILRLRKLRMSGTISSALSSSAKCPVSIR